MIADHWLLIMGKNMEENCTREVIALHQFFEDWFKGVLADTATVSPCFTVRSIPAIFEDSASGAVMRHPVAALIAALPPA
jgi:hypothetical protein